MDRIVFLLFGCIMLYTQDTTYIIPNPSIDSLSTYIVPKDSFQEQLLYKKYGAPLNIKVDTILPTKESKSGIKKTITFKDIQFTILKIQDEDILLKAKIDRKGLALPFNLKIGMLRAEFIHSLQLKGFDFKNDQALRIAPFDESKVNLKFELKNNKLVSIQWNYNFE